MIIGIIASLLVTKGVLAATGRAVLVIDGEGLPC